MHFTDTIRVETIKVLYPKFHRHKALKRLVDAAVDQVMITTEEYDTSGHHISAYEAFGAVWGSVFGSVIEKMTPQGYFGLIDSLIDPAEHELRAEIHIATKLTWDLLESHRPARNSDLP